MTDADKLVERLREILVNNSIESTDNASFHSWRCRYPDRYGPCTCFDELMLEVKEAVIVSHSQAGEGAVETVIRECADLCDPGSATDDISDAYHRGFMFGVKGCRTAILVKLGSHPAPINEPVAAQERAEEAPLSIRSVGIGGDPASATAPVPAEEMGMPEEPERANEFMPRKVVVAASDYDALRSVCQKALQERANAFQLNEQLTDMVNGEREMRMETEAKLAEAVEALREQRRQMTYPDLPPVFAATMKTMLDAAIDEAMKHAS